MSIFNFRDDEALGQVVLADTGSVNVVADNIEQLRMFHVNQLTVLHSRKPGQYLVGTVVKVTQSHQGNEHLPNQRSDNTKTNLITIRLIGTFYNRIGKKYNYFGRTLESIPNIGTYCFVLEGERLSDFMKIVSSQEMDGAELSIGRFMLHEHTFAYLNGNKFFQRHAIISGSTGSGKSTTTARLLEQMSNLPQSNAVVFDIHKEYQKIKGKAFRKIRIAGPIDKGTARSLKSDVLHLPYWLLEYEDLITVLGLPNVRTASIQGEVVRNAILKAKKKSADELSDVFPQHNINLDSPIPFKIEYALKYMKREAESSYIDKTTRKADCDNIIRLIEKTRRRMDDPRLAFLFDAPNECYKVEWLTDMINQMTSGTGSKSRNKRGGIKIIDFSSVPSEFLSLTTSLVAHILFNTRIWADKNNRHPLIIVCDEADRYMSPRERRVVGITDHSSIFDRIAREGRKYGIGLIVVCQRPKNISNTVISQCNNMIIMRLPSKEDRNAISGFLSDNSADFDNLIPALDVGEAVVIGDAVIFPSHIKISQPGPEVRPDSHTVNFWSEWNRNEVEMDAKQAVHSWILRGVPNYDDS